MEKIMNEYKLIKKDDETVVIIKHTAVTIEEHLDIFENFLRACGYYFNGRIEIVKDEE
jgi:hypothetical protein